MISFKILCGTFYLCCLGFIAAVLFNIVMDTTDKTSKICWKFTLLFLSLNVANIAYNSIGKCVLDLQLFQKEDIYFHKKCDICKDWIS